MVFVLSLFNVGKANKASSLNDDQLDERKIRPDEMVKRENVKGSPFAIVQTQDKTFIALGMYKVSQDGLTYDQCKEAIKTKDWSLILNVARLIAMDEIKVDQETRKAEREQMKKQGVNHNPNKYK